ncbi:MAG: cell filamentation protein Fic [Bacteroides sp.]|nr:cell filamentation protein Fic [Bacteroides sp.]
MSKRRKRLKGCLGTYFQEGELDETMVVRYFRTTTLHVTIENKLQSHEVNYYNFDVIISVGYRVKSKQGTQ